VDLSGGSEVDHIFTGGGIHRAAAVVEELADASQNRMVPLRVDAVVNLGKGVAERIRCERTSEPCYNSDGYVSWGPWSEIPARIDVVISDTQLVGQRVKARVFYSNMPSLKVKGRTLY